MRRKIIVLSLSIILLIGTAVTATYAAYLKGLTASVGNLEMSLYKDNYSLVSIDGVNFSENLGKDEIYKAVVASSKGYTVGADGNFYDGMKLVETSDDFVKTELKKISLSPITSSDGIIFERVSYSGINQSVDVASGAYISFDLYFKANVDTPFDLCFNNEANNYDASKQVLNISSDYSELNSNQAFSLKSGFEAYDELGNITYYKKDTKGFKIRPSDAMRFSTIVEDKAKIYEPSIGIGSYATSLDSELYNDSYKSIASRFDSNKNASYTYSVNQGASFSPINYDACPSSYQSFDLLDSLKIVSFKQKDEIKKVKFNFWLEGWDADCFEGIQGTNINISLSFRGMQSIDSYRINYHDGDNVTSVDYLSSALLNTVPYNIPYKKGKKFMGWYLEESFDTLFDQSVLSTDQVGDVYAKWQ